MRRHIVYASTMLFLGLGTAAFGHHDPPFCFQAGASIVISQYRADGVTGIVGSVSECETITYRATLEKPADFDSICAFSGGVLTLVTPDGVEHTVSANGPCIGGNGGEGCDATVDSISSALIPYTVNPADRLRLGPCHVDADCPAGSECLAGECRQQLVARGHYTGFYVHDSPIDSGPLETGSANVANLVECHTNNSCEIGGCDPTKQGSSACFFTPIACQSDVPGQFGACTCTGDPGATLCSCDPNFYPICGDGVAEIAKGEQCDEGKNGNGAPWSCCTAECTFRAGGETCRPPVQDGGADSACDLAETCSGTSGSCPDDAVAPATTLCRDSKGVCDEPDYCDGVTPRCPAIDAKRIGTVCRQSNSLCDLAETCEPGNDDCPPDDKAKPGTSCGGGNVCGEGGLCLQNCGNGTIDPGEQCDRDARPDDTWCLPDCTAVSCSWEAIDADLQNGELSGTANLRAIVCSLSAPVDGAECGAADRNDLNLANGVRISLRKRVDKLGTGARIPLVVQRLQGARRKLLRPGKRIDPVTACGRSQIVPALLTWQRLIDRLLAAIR